MAEPLELELGSCFMEAPLDEPEERVVFAEIRRELLHAEIAVAPIGLATKRVVGRLRGHHSLAGAIAASRERRKIFTADESGIWEFSLDGSNPAFITGPPELPALTAEAAREAFGRESPTLARRTGQATFHWLFEVNRTGDTLYAYCSQQSAMGALVEVSLQNRVISGVAPLPGFCAGIRASIEHNLVVLPLVHGGPRALDLRGNVLGILREHAPEIAGRSFSEAAVRPADGAILLSEHEGGLWLWDWKRKVATRVADDGQAPTYADDGTIFFMRTSAELWRLQPGGTPEPVARAAGHVGGTEWERRRSWTVPPKLSRNGRYLLVQLSVMGRATTHSVVVIDLERQQLQRAAGRHHHSIAWF